MLGRLFLLVYLFLCFGGIAFFFNFCGGFNEVFRLYLGIMPFLFCFKARFSDGWTQKRCEVPRYALLVSNSVFVSLFLVHNVFVVWILCLIWCRSLTWKELLYNGRLIKAALVLWLVSAIFVVVLLGRIDWIVHHELYDFGLQFSPEWAVNYWAAVRMIYVFIAVPVVLSVTYFGLEVWRLVKGEKNVARRKPVQAAKPISKGVENAETNHMLINCPKCKRVFSKPLVMLDFSGGKTRLVNVCPYCNYVLNLAEENTTEKKNASIEFVDLDKKQVEQK